MLIDTYSADHAESLRRQFHALPDGRQLMLLIDGVCLPGIFRKLAAHQPVLLFASLPGCTEDTKDVSPFVVRYDPASASLARVLNSCSGWPMLSAIATDETAEKLAQRLAAWCVIEVDGQRFNFRFTDTRRMPAIFHTLTQSQRAEMLGNAVSWRYIGRDGSWADLPVTPSGHDDPPLATNAHLNDAQFARLVSDSEADEMWVRLRDRGVRSRLSPSRRHALLSAALEVANKHGVNQPATVRWCEACMHMEATDVDALAGRFIQWSSENGSTSDASSPNTV